MQLTLKKFQIEALHALGVDPHVLCVAPTGSGKSLIYETWVQRKQVRTWMVSPLVSLARQQFGRAVQKGIACELIAGGDRIRGPQGVGGPMMKIMSPECLEYSGYWRELVEWKPEFMVVDECHCFWEWGRSFRPSYSRIPNEMKRLEIRQSLWLTATMPPLARQDLRQSLAPLSLRELGRFAIPEGLKLTTVHASYSDRLEILKHWIQKDSRCGLVFVNSRRWAERLCVELQKNHGKSVAFYHAGLGAEERKNIETLLYAEKIRVVVSTSAFGMGMDFSSIDWVILWQPPWSLLALAQAIGRVGRNGRKGEAWVFWSNEDFFHSGGGQPHSEEWEDVKKWCFSAENKRDALIRYFNDSENSSPS